MNPIQRMTRFPCFLVGAAFVALVPAAAAHAKAAQALARTEAVAGTNGKIAFVSNRSGDNQIYLVNRDGTGLSRLIFKDISARALAWSPDGTELAFSGTANGNTDIYTINADGTNLQRLTTDPAPDDDPAWTADGTRIVYDRGLFGCPCQLRVMRADGSSDHSLDTGPGNAFAPATAPHGDRFAFVSDRTGQPALYTWSLAGGPILQITAGSPGGDQDPHWSPTGNDIAFDRRSGTGTAGIYLVHANGTGLRQLVSTPGIFDSDPTWAPDGSELLFVSGANGPQHLFAIHPDGSDQTAVSTIPRAPFLETFDSGVLDNSLWHTISDSGGAIGEVNGRLEASISHDADPSLHNYDQVDEHIGSQCTLNGDFDLQVDYSLVTWPPHNGFFAMLNAIYADGAIARTSMPWAPPADEQYNAWTNGPPFTNDVIDTTDTSGQFRLVRNNGIMSAYERASTTADWTLVHSGVATGNTVAAMGLWAPGSSFAHEDGLVAYDNFRLNSGDFTCPSWWGDTAASWQATTPRGD
jgi:dipeptidyl aminopeptidase/acylaminoacyl peptidase